MKIGDAIIYFDRQGQGHDALVEMPDADASGRVALFYIDSGKSPFLGSPDFHLAIIREAGVQPSEEVADKLHCYADPRAIPAAPKEESPAVPESGKANGQAKESEQASEGSIQ